MPPTSSATTSPACAARGSIDYDVEANWKAIIENYSECYHCPGVHPQLNRITHYNSGEGLEGDGPWRGGWMPVRGAETMAADGGHGSRPAIAGLTEDEHKKISTSRWPNLLVCSTRTT